MTPRTCLISGIPFFGLLKNGTPLQQIRHLGARPLRRGMHAAPKFITRSTHKTAVSPEEERDLQMTSGWVDRVIKMRRMNAMDTSYSPSVMPNNIIAVSPTVANDDVVSPL